MKLRIYNTLSRKIEDFEPLNPPRVTMYVCGITAYDSSHLGHARSAIIFDVLFRILRWLCYEVLYVRNITDIDDKIINRANREGLFWKDITERYTQEYQEEMEKLGVLKPTFEPKASEHIHEIISLIEKLINGGLAYVSEGDVYFAVEKFKGYGKLSGRKLEELLSGVRIDPSEKKRNPLDFALWKSAKPGEPFWESPWGFGRPGWHIECSAMSLKYLGETIDIHGGGLDLIFPHHENEIAQSEGATGKTFVRYFIHHGLITVEGEKMSKSLGNFVTTAYLLEKYHPEVIRAFLLSKHYRSPLDYSEKNIQETEKAMYRLYETLYWINKATPKKEGGLLPRSKSLKEALSKFKETFVQALLEDLNTALALGHLFALEGELYNFINRFKDLTTEEVTLLKEALKEIQELSGGLLGIAKTDPEAFFFSEKERKLKAKGKTLNEVEELIQKRFEARLEKNFALADSIRTELQKLGIQLKDTKEETFWFVE
ncbi:cysteinyl-tRNA synthetase [Caldimicrobium thiodismutans]|uniref:Cysteine--tRNA ligase n=1 Tax=Caldimicrobium thiodismutans TaxID=1653476 RepID=A0A0U5APU4_9BACT|nr:cysteine--tRNA ligase [Caldimicrobium thiodismutans]BAU23954.1 cysteinyl-tRNA synthetase [Caldimicrobium thiodismutans]